MDDKIHMMTDHVDVVEKHLTLQIEKANKEIDRLKFDMIDVIDQRHEQMMKVFEQELASIKSKYDDTIQKITNATEGLRDMFKGKVQKIKEKSAIFFARMEMKL